jgi:hypothetical protein
MKTSPHDLEQQIRAHYQQVLGDPPPSAALWLQIADRLPTQEHPLPWWQRRRQAFVPSNGAVPVSSRWTLTRRLVVIGSLQCTLAVVSGLVYAVGIFRSSHRNTPGVSSSQLLTKLLQSDQRESIQQLAQSDQFTVDQMQMVNADTVRIQKILADSNNIILAYTIDGSTPIPPKEMKPAITLPGGHTLPMLSSDSEFSSTSMSDALHGIPPIAVLAVFDATSIQGYPQSVSLQITIPSGGTSAAHFNMNVPFYAGKTVTINQTDTLNGQALTLDRVVITLSETRLYYITGPADLGNLSGRLSFNETAFPYMGMGGPNRLGESYISFPTDFLDKTGTWVVKIATIPISKVIEQGSWQFTFPVA